MACKDQDVLFRPVDPPKDDGHIGGDAAKESSGSDAKFSCLNTHSDIALPKTKQHIRNNHGMQRSRCFVQAR